MNPIRIKSAVRFVCAGVLALSALAARADWQPMGPPADQPHFLPQAFLATSGAPNGIDTTQLVWGSSLTVNQMSTPGAGTVSVTLADIKWPEALSSLSFLITDLHQTWQRLDGAGTLNFTVDGPTHLFAAVFAQAGPDTHAGLYDLSVTFAPVPLPAAGLLLFSGVAGLGALTRRRKKT